MSETPATSRSSRRNSQKPDKSKQSITGLSKKMNILVAGIVGAGLLAAAGIGVVSRDTRSVALDTSPENSSTKFYFQDTPPIDGWKTNTSAVLEGRGDLTAAQNPAQYFSPDEKCSYTRQVLHLPEYNSGRTDEYLTRAYLYDVAESNGNPAKDAQTVSIRADKGNIDFLSASYSVSSPNDRDKKADSSVYRSNAVRAIDKVVQIEGVKESDGLYGSDASKGVPVFFLSYECNSEADWNADTWQTLLDSTKVNLFSEEVPEQAKVETAAPNAPLTSQPAEEESPKPNKPEASSTASPTASTEPDSAESAEEKP